MKNKMFKIVGGFSFFVAIIALIGAIGLGVVGINAFMGEADESKDISVATVNDYIKSKTSSGSEEVPQSSSQVEESNQENNEYQKSLAEKFDTIITSIDNFSEITSQSGASRKGLENYLIKATKATNRDEYLEFLTTLGDELKNLESKANEIASMKPEDPKYIKWDGFLEWYTTSYMKSFNSEKDRIAIETINAQAEKAEGLTILISAGSMFSVFVLFALIMLLVQIETNTRKQTA